MGRPVRLSPCRIKLSRAHSEPSRHAVPRVAHRTRPFYRKRPRMSAASGNLARRAVGPQVPFRLPDSLLAGLNAHIERLRRLVPGPRFTRADAARALPARGLEAVQPEERERG